MTQQSMFDKSEAEARFDEYHAKNPQVYDKLEELTWGLYNAGRRRIGINMLVEVVRWQTMLNTKGDKFKINNNYAPRYARLLVENNPAFKGLFQQRELRS